MSERELRIDSIRAACIEISYQSFPVGSGMGFECHRNGKFYSSIRPEDIGDLTPEWLRLTNDCDTLVPKQMVFDHFSKERTEFQENCQNQIMKERGLIN